MLDGNLRKLLPAKRAIVQVGSKFDVRPVSVRRRRRRRRRPRPWLSELIGRF